MYGARLPMGTLTGHGRRVIHIDQGRRPMITLTRLTGAVFALNPDLVERVDDGVDTVITLVDGTKYRVRESLADISDAIVDYRARVLAAAGLVEARAVALGTQERRLSAVQHRDAHVVAIHQPEEG